MTKRERETRRIYSSQSLEYWFQRLLTAWEQAFSVTELKWGRQIYHGGVIRLIELDGWNATVHAQLGGEEGNDAYTILSWEAHRLRIRGSTRQRDRVRALAVGGLYEIEELVAQEIPALPPQRDKHHRYPDASGVSRVSRASDPDSAAALVRESAPTALPTKLQARQRPFIVRLALVEEGLEVRPFWVTDDGVREPVLGSGRRNGSLCCCAAERREWIRLINAAHKSHFRLSRESYVLSDPRRIEVFVKHHISSWERRFTLEKDTSVDLLRKGVQQLEAAAQATLNECGQLRLRWRLRLGSHWLTDAECRSVLSQRRRGYLFLAHVGIVALPRASAAVIDEWEPAAIHLPSEGPPRYMLYSLFSKESVKVALSPELERWRRSLCTRPRLKRGHRLYAGLRPYQKEGVLWLRHLCIHGCHPLLADEMGLGKTLQVLALLDAWQISDRPHLIVCPASVVPVWRSEVRTFFPKMQTAVLTSGCDFKTHSEPCLWIASYTQLRRHKALLQHVSFGYAVLDEAQCIKNPDAKVTSACLAIRAQHRLALTGTPLENRYRDIWTLFRFLMPGLLGGRHAFESALQEDPSSFGARLRQQIAPFILRRSKKTVLSELPEKVEMQLTCPLSPVQREEYRRLTEQALIRWEDDLKQELRSHSLHVFALLARLRQVCCDPSLLPWRPADDWRQSGKLVALIDTLTPVLAHGSKVVIFSQFVALLQRVRSTVEAQFPNVPVYTLTGSTTDRAAPVAAFQQQTGSGIFLASLRAGGVGLNLNTADYAFLLDPWWNPSVEAQAVDRLHRIGRRGTVFVYRLLTEGTVEARIQDLQSEKRVLFTETVGRLDGLKGLVRHFRTLSDLIALR